MSGNDLNGRHYGRGSIVLLRWAARIAFFFLCGIALVLSLADPANLSVIENVWDKLNHATGYFGLICSGDLGFQTGRRLWQKGLIVFAYGGFLEMLQHLLPYRDFSFSDMLANLCGILVFLAVVRLLKHAPIYRAFQRQNGPGPGD